jgi:hypothetical protein
MNTKLEKDIFKELKFLTQNEFFKDTRKVDIPGNFIKLYSNKTEEDNINEEIINEVKDFVSNSSAFCKTPFLSETNKDTFISEIDETLEMINKSYITVLIVEPKKEAFYKEIKNDINDFQSIVRGNVKKIKISDKVYLLKNEKEKNLPANRTYNNQIIRGTFFLAGNDNNEVISLDNELIKYYIKKFDLQNYIGTTDNLMGIRRNTNGRK